MKTQHELANFCLNCGTALEIQPRHRQCPSCGRHFYFNAKPTVSLWLTNSKGEVLLTKRSIDPFKDWWDIPGGFVEENETLEEAAWRELKEETGLDRVRLEYIGSVHEDYYFMNEIIPIVAAIFKGTIDVSVEFEPGDDVGECRLVAIEELDLDKVAFDNQRKFLKEMLG